MRKTIIILVSTDHLTDRLWFRDDDDFKVGMNLIAVIAHTSRVRILAFILMSNHVHFVIAGSQEDIERVITEFKRRYSNYYQRKYGIKEFLRKNKVDFKMIDPNGEAPERAIAYVLMNSVAANICPNAFFYPWGSASVYFNPAPRSGKRVGDYSGNGLKRLIHSKQPLPPEYIILDAGYVDPASFVAKGYVEHQFRTPARMNYFLNSSSKARARLEEKALPSFRDQNILSSAKDLCMSLFRKGNVLELTDTQLGELLRQLRYRFSADISQLARILGRPYAEVVRLLDTI
ncbi:MAG: transposase [Bacteroidales bacterium]|nr:transposase [Bacteroidales bacterium]